MAMILLRRRAYLDTHRLVAGEWPREELGRGVELAGKRLGIVGLGSIGGMTARKARALDMRVLASDPYLAVTHDNWNIAERLPLDELLAVSDVITIHCPLNNETRGMIAAPQLERMKKGAILINSARGGIVDEGACAAALRSGQLGGAALDVFDYEPIRKPTGEMFAGITNVILTPHISGVTIESNHRVSFMTVENVIRVLKKGR
jgi:(S)-sulfolactate dehydrogenase